jgi:hypothetical protein
MVCIANLLGCDRGSAARSRLTTLFTIHLELTPVINLHLIELCRASRYDSRCSILWSTAGFDVTEIQVRFPVQFHFQIETESASAAGCANLGTSFGEKESGREEKEGKSAGAAFRARDGGLASETIFG